MDSKSGIRELRPNRPSKVIVMLLAKRLSFLSATTFLSSTGVDGPGQRRQGLSYIMTLLVCYIKKTIAQPWAFQAAIES